MALGMCSTGILRGVGDARRAMYVTLAGGIAAAIMDPILIFGLDLGITGAAISTLLSRFALLAVGLHGAIVVHRLVRLPDFSAFRTTLRPFFSIGGPAVMTQLATPVGNAYVTAEIAAFGDGAVAGWAIIGRLIPVAFGVIFSLSGAVGPILGQNYGAKLYHRLFETMRDALIFTMLYVLVVWGLLALFAGGIADIFRAQNEARELVVFFCVFASASFLFNGALFVANAAFNNLGFALYSTVLNWGRSTLGVIPFVWVGAHHFGAIGVIGGWALGAVVFGIAAVFLCFRVVASIESRDRPDHDQLPGPPPTAQSPFSHRQGGNAGLAGRLPDPLFQGALELAPYLVIDRLGGLDDLRRLEEIHHPEIGNGRLDEDIRRLHPQLQFEDRAHHQLRRAVEAVNGLRDVARIAARRADDVNAEGDVGLADDMVVGHRIEDAAVDEDAAVAAHRAEQRRNSRGSRQRRPQFAFGKDSLVMAVEIGGDHVQRYAEGGKFVRDDVRHEVLDDALHVELAKTETAVDRRRDRGRAAEQPGDDVGAVAGKALRVFPDLPAGHAAGHCRAHDGANGGAADGDRTDAHVVEGADDVDMRQAARAAATEGHGDRRIAGTARHGCLVFASRLVHRLRKS